VAEADDDAPDIELDDQGFPAILKGKTVECDRASVDSLLEAAMAESPLQARKREVKVAAMTSRKKKTAPQITTPKPSRTGPTVTPVKSALPPKNAKHIMGSAGPRLIDTSSGTLRFTYASKQSYVHLEKLYLCGMSASAAEAVGKNHTLLMTRLGERLAEAPIITKEVAVNLRDKLLSEAI
jgi:hypothetical protein